MILEYIKKFYKKELWKKKDVDPFEKFPAIFIPTVNDKHYDPEAIPFHLPPKLTLAAPKEYKGTPPWMTLAISLQGTKEVPGSKNNPVILEWAKSMAATKNVYKADSTPWCGLFTGYCLVKSGMPGDESPLWALSWNDYGHKLDAPAYGCVMVFVRDGGGHVGFYVSEDAQYYHILGGNQNDAVNVMRIAKNRCRGFRWPKGGEAWYKPGRIKKTFAGKVSVNEA